MLRQLSFLSMRASSMPRNAQIRYSSDYKRKDTIDDTRNLRIIPKKENQLEKSSPVLSPETRELQNIRKEIKKTRKQMKGAEENTNIFRTVAGIAALFWFF